MKSARIALFTPKPSAHPKAPFLTGVVELPAALVWELAQMLQQGQGLTIKEQSGEQVFSLRLSAWRGDGQPQQPQLTGLIEAPSEAAAYRNQLMAPPATPAYPPAPAAAPPAYAQPPAAAPPAAAPPGYAPAGWPVPAAPVVPAPAPAAPVAPPTWGQPGHGAWGQ